MKDFYSDSLNIDVRFKHYGEINRKNLNKTHIAIEYTTLDKFLKHPKKAFYVFGGQYSIEKLQTNINTFQKSEGWDYKTTELVVSELSKIEIKSTFQGIAGYGNKRNNRALILPCKTWNKTKKENELINAYAFVICHEIGHILSLQHSKKIGCLKKYGLQNFMRQQLRLRDIFEFNVEINPEQINQINQYLKDSK